MSKVFFDEMKMKKPDVNLHVGSGSHAEQTAKMLIGVENSIDEYKPGWVLVYGDTNSTIAGALAAAKMHVPVAHVEAGLRSFNRRMPEEINRVLCDAISDILFTPTDIASTNLRNEGVEESKIQQVGDVMYDAALQFSKLATGETLSEHSLDSKGYVLATIHRAENTDKGGIHFTLVLLNFLNIIRPWATTRTRVTVYSR